MTHPNVNSQAAVDELLRILRRYAFSQVGEKLIQELAELYRAGVAGLAAFEPGSDERIVETVLAGIHQTLAVIVSDLFYELAESAVEIHDWAEDIDPEDFGR